MTRIVREVNHFSRTIQNSIFFREIIHTNHTVYNAPYVAPYVAPVYNAPYVAGNEFRTFNLCEIVSNSA